MTRTIDQFQGKYRFLSNFWNCPVTYGGITYKNTEAAFQAQKCTDPADRVHFSGLDPPSAKRRGRRVKLRPDWESVKDGLMADIVTAKFEQHPELAARLIATAPAELIEGNSWGDTYWGVCGGQGENRLGLILMAVRSKLAGN